MEHKTFPCLVIKADEEQGIVDAVFAVMGNIDLGLDVIHPGAFTKTFMEQGRKVKVLDQHRTDSTEAVIGKPLELREIGVDELPATLKAEYPQATGGAFARVQMLMDTYLGREVFIRLRDQALNEWSFGYDALDVDYETVTLNGKQEEIRNLRTLKLYEISPVIWGMNPATTTTGAKAKQEEEKPYDIFQDGDEYCVYRVDEDGNQMGDSLGCHPTREEAEDQLQAILISEAEDEQGKDKGATGKAGLPLAPRERAWDASAAEGRVRSWAGGEDDTDWAKYRQAFFWYDSGAADQFGSYKLPFADVIGGELQAVPRGIFAVAAVLQGARGGTSIPAGDVSSIKSKVNSYYAAMRSEFNDDSIVPPWDKAWDIIDRFMREYYKEGGVGEPTIDDVKAATVHAFEKYYMLLGSTGTISTSSDNIVWVGTSVGIGSDSTTHVSSQSIVRNEEEKVGRVLSARNAGRIVTALMGLIDVLEAAGIDIPKYGSEEEEEEEEEKLSNELADKLEKDGAGPEFPPTLLIEIERELLELAMED